MIPSFKNKRILIAPLDWGIGHATRCVPIIEHLKTDNTVYIGVTSANRHFFSTLFPDLPQLVLPAYNVRYHAFLPAWLKVLLQRGAINKVIAAEHQLLKKLVPTETIDVIISDNRFGCYHKDVTSIYITHQLSIKIPVLGWLAQRINKNYLSRFQEIWVPDTENMDTSLGGALSHPRALKRIHSNIRYIGPLSRLKKVAPEAANSDYLLILSGPEPQQSILKNMVIQLAAKYAGKKVTIVQTDVSNLSDTGNLKFINGTQPETLSKLIASSKTIICRSGYSTLMDLHHFLPLNIILVPTPGQPEQMYLAKYWEKRFNCQVVKQEDLLQLSL